MISGRVSLMPNGPSVSQVISLIKICAMVPKAKVTIARYGPTTFRAGKAKIPPKNAVTRIEAGMVAQIGKPNWKNKIPAV